MTAQVFALLIGINRYQSEDIWNLRSATLDARAVERWLVHDLQVPGGHICTLLDSQATKRTIEDKFMSHLVNNPLIEPGDALIVYFAGHGSSIRAPPGWFDQGRGDVPVLCPYDYDIKHRTRHVNAGISDRSLHAMLQDLAQVKGDNVTLILDTCFSLPPTGDMEPKERRYVRYTPTRKATSEDLLAGLWRSAIPHEAEPMARRGFTRSSSPSHVVLAACGAGWVATERLDGGNFTRAMLALKDSRPLHKVAYSDVPHDLAPYLGDHQYAACAGLHTDRILFAGVPFSVDPHFVSATMQDNDHLRIDAGAIHGVSVGTEFTLHPHHHRGSLNTPLGVFVAKEVFSTWCIAGCNAPVKDVLRDGWVRITRWNNPSPFRVTIRHSLFHFCRRSRLARKIPSEAADVLHGRGVAVVRTGRSRDADLTLCLRSRGLTAERHDPLISETCSVTLSIPSAGTRTDMRAVEAAARFHMHLYRTNPSRPFAHALKMELFRLDPATWTRVSGNLLVKGHAQLVDDEENSIYAVVLHNHSDVDLWPYLAYFDAGGYSIAMVHHPDPASPIPPLRRHSRMVIGSGSSESEALSFALADSAHPGAGFFKLFVSTVYTRMSVLEQGTSPTVVQDSFLDQDDHFKRLAHATDGILWDTFLASVTISSTAPA
ncbi:hypothetical protein BV20DRAFT_470720 [Pilatotrama ljubarskyi]|nr:hypothetical protein BV20DRAFT_470720 [Pilatotrama ljubarskyi]